ncbi:methyltransferase [Fischerella sp. JS2]|uniref:methyltransferase n=1 Tax=Fischerella sp. JS2 TaxID=2597771 RepID=UPI0028EF0F2A|nr:methyltransferase [Fischerella sp. JS2]
MFLQENTQISQDMPSQTAMIQLATSYWVSRAIYAAAKLGIADMLKDGSHSCDELANWTGTNAQALYRVMRALASVGIFAENEQGCFTLTPLATYLQSDVPNSIRAFAISFGEEHYRAWGDIVYSIQTGDNAFQNLYGMPVFEYYAQNPQAGKTFDEAMTNVSATDKTEIVAAYDFSSIRKLVDVGGGHGSFIASILKVNPTMEGILFERPSVVEGAKSVLEAEGVLKRCQIIAGSFFESVPSDGDAYILKYVIHLLDDERAIALLRNCHSAMVENGKLLLVEQILPPGNEPSWGKFLDIHMLIAISGGRERTKMEFQTLFEASGFKLNKVITTESNTNVIEGIRV